MPEICRFYGIIIKMFFEDHNPPHFHAEYGSFEALVEVDTLAIIGGKLPPRALGLVMEWLPYIRRNCFYYGRMPKSKNLLEKSNL